MKTVSIPKITGLVVIFVFSILLGFVFIYHIRIERQKALIESQYELITSYREAYTLLKEIRKQEQNKHYLLVDSLVIKINKP